MYQFLYVSSAVRPFTSFEISRLAARCQVRNNALGITGLCLYIGGNFMQAFEGREKDARTLFERIKTDERHRHVTTLLAGEAGPERVFGDWSMDFRQTEDIPAAFLPGLRSFIDDALSGKMAHQAGLAINLLGAFVMTMQPHSKARLH